MLRLFKKNEKVQVVRDQWGNPAYTNDLVNLIMSLINTKSDCYGLYNFSCYAKITWYEFADEILKLVKKYSLIKNNPVLEGLSFSEYKTRDRRPMSSCLAKEKLTKNLRREIPEWKDSLESFFSGLK